MENQIEKKINQLIGSWVAKKLYPGNIVDLRKQILQAIEENRKQWSVGNLIDEVLGCG